MTVNSLLIAVFAVAGLLIAGCAGSPEVEDRRAAITADIAEILSLPTTSGEQSEPERCLSGSQFDSYRPLGDRYLLFTGLGNRQWINTLRSRCPDLDRSDTLIMRPFSGTRVCHTDKFEVAEWFEWPRYLGTGPVCFLGEFHPVTDAQLDEIEARLEDW